MASGISASLNYLFGFIAIKVYYNLETWLSLPGVTLFNCIVIGIGLVLMYNILPETENRTLADIEAHFADRTKKITDHNILKPEIPKPCEIQTQNDSRRVSTVPSGTDRRSNN